MQVVEVGTRYRTLNRASIFGQTSTLCIGRVVGNLLFARFSGMMIHSPPVKKELQISDFVFEKRLILFWLDE
jgi:hypothetical protein